MYHWFLKQNHPLVSYVDPRVEGDSLCVLIPYRDRKEELNEFIPHMHAFLKAQDVKHRFIVLNQTETYRFNRASLINVGWYEADRLYCNYMVMHDVDLLPQNPELSYSNPGKGHVMHVAAGPYHPKKRYDYPKFIGGILIITTADYRLVDGMSNKYWGWGLEDDEFFLRLKDAKLKIHRPENLTTDRTNTFKHVHDDRLRRRDYAYTPLQKEMSHRRDHISGLKTVKYSIVGRRILEFEGGATAAVVDIDLVCDRSWTPYCLPQ